MNWKSWPYWVKGAVVGSALGVIIFLLLLFWNAYPLWAIGILFFSLVPGFMLAGSFAIQDGNPIPNFGVAAFSNIIAYAIIGAFIGYLYGRFKNRKKLSINP